MFEHNNDTGDFDVWHSYLISVEQDISSYTTPEQLQKALPTDVFTGEAVTEALKGLSLETFEQEQSPQTKLNRAAQAHEEYAGKIIDQVLHRLAVEQTKTFKWFHQISNRTYKNGDNIRPDYQLGDSKEGRRGKTVIADAKCYNGNLPTEQYNKILRDMSDTRVSPVDITNALFSN